MPQSIEEFHKNHENHYLRRNDHSLESSNGIDSIQDTACLYALKKRLFVPKWWVVSVLLSFGSQRPWHNFLLKEFNVFNVFE